MYQLVFGVVGGVGGGGGGGGGGCADSVVLPRRLLMPWVMWVTSLFLRGFSGRKCQCLLH